MVKVIDVYYNVYCICIMLSSSIEVFSYPFQQCWLCRVLHIGMSPYNHCIKRVKQ